MTPTPLIRIVDDEADVRDTLSALFAAEGWPVKAYESAEAFLTEDAPSVLGCLVLDVQMPGLTGPELQDKMTARGITLPIVFFSGHGTMESAVRAMKKGAVNFLAKTVSRAELVSAVSEALSSQSLPSGLSDTALVAAYRRLTDLERHVAQLAAEGLVNGDIAKALGLTPKTVRNQKVLVKQKLGAETSADLITVIKKAEALLHADQP